LVGINASYYTPFGCCCLLTERRITLNSGEFLELRPDGETLKQAIALDANSEHQLAYSLRLRPFLMAQTPADCRAGDLEIKLTTRKSKALSLRVVSKFYRFEENEARIAPSEGIRVVKGFRDEDLERGVRELHLPQQIYERLRQLSPCMRYVVATTHSNDILQANLLGRDDRTWLQDVRNHCTGGQ
jgi:hypothetical protein